MSITKKQDVENKNDVAVGKAMMGVKVVDASLGDVVTKLSTMFREQEIRARGLYDDKVELREYVAILSSQGSDVIYDDDIDLVKKRIAYKQEQLRTTMAVLDIARKNVRDIIANEVEYD